MQRKANLQFSVEGETVVGADRVLTVFAAIRFFNASEVINPSFTLALKIRFRS